MNKAGLVEVVNATLGTTKVQAEAVVDTMIDTIIKTLSKGDEVAIAGLGKFVVKQRKARDARNPKTGETVKVPATKVPKFSAAKALKDAVKSLTFLLRNTKARQIVALLCFYIYLLFSKKSTSIMNIYFRIMGNTPLFSVFNRP